MIHKAECPQCGNDVEVGSQPRIGKQVECKSCGAELEVVWLDPLEVDWPLLDDDEDYEDMDDIEDEEY
jgi:alpha-aminoadipate carrier protein LysW